MSTRCNVLLRTPEGSAIWFYRHCDGYPSFAGRAIDSLYTAHIVSFPSGSRGWAWIGDFAERMVLARDETGDVVWRLTAGPHSDIEYCYVIDFPGFESKDSKAQSYVSNVNKLTFRWAGGGYGKEVVARAQVQRPLNPEGFRQSIYRDEADRYVSSDGEEKMK